MATIPEQLSNILANSQGKPDANLAQDANNLGGLPAEDFATKEYVKKYHDEKEAKQKEYIDNQDTEMLKQANEFANSLVRNQDFSSFAKLTDVQALDIKLSGELTSGLSNQKAYTDKEIEKVVNDTNENFKNVNGAITTLNGNMSNLFQSVSDGKSKIAGAITDKGVSTSATDTFDNMANNIRSIPTTGGEIPEGYIDTSSATASDSDLIQGKTAFARGNKIIGSHVCSGLDTSDATATANDIREGITAYSNGQKLIGTLKTGEISSEDVIDEKIYGTDPNSLQVSQYSISDYTLICYAFSEHSNEFKHLIKINNTSKEIRTYKISNGFKNEKIYSFSDLGLKAKDENIDIEIRACNCTFTNDKTKRYLALLVTNKDYTKASLNLVYFDFEVITDSNDLALILLENKSIDISEPPVGIGFIGYTLSDTKILISDNGEKLAIKYKDTNTYPYNSAIIIFQIYASILSATEISHMLLINRKTEATWFVNDELIAYQIGVFGNLGIGYIKLQDTKVISQGSLSQCLVLNKDCSKAILHNGKRGEEFRLIYADIEENETDRYFYYV